MIGDGQAGEVCMVLHVGKQLVDAHHAIAQVGVDVEISLARRHGSRVMHSSSASRELVAPEGAKHVPLVWIPAHPLLQDRDDALHERAKVLLPVAAGREADGLGGEAAVTAPFLTHKGNRHQARPSAKSESGHSSRHAERPTQEGYFDTVLDAGLGVDGDTEHLIAAENAKQAASGLLHWYHPHAGAFP